MREQPFNKHTYRPIIFMILVLIGLYSSSIYSYLLFHSLAELFSIIVACSIFMLVWNSRHIMDNTYFLYIGIAYLFIGGLDLSHTLAYKGMGVFPGSDTNMPTQLWVAARYVESLSLLIAPLFLGRKFKTSFVFCGYFLISLLLLCSIFYWKIFPTCFVEGVGLTSFKKASEYIISIILLASIAILFIKRHKFDLDILRLLTAAIILTIFSEWSFTFYLHAYGLSNLIGHYLKIISFYLVYHAIIVLGLTKPYTMLFRNLKQSEESLQEARKELETRVIERTSELSESNKLLSEEIGVRMRAERALKQSENRYRKVSELTSDLAYAFEVDQNAGMTLEWVSGPLNRITGFTLEELRIRGGWNSIVHPDDLPIVEEQLKALLDGRSKKAQYRIKTSRGNVRWLLDYGQPEFDKKQRRVTNIYGAVRDITERKAAENELEKSEQKYRQLVENANEGITVAQDGLLKFVNPQMAKILGYSEQEISSRPFIDFVHPDDQKIAMAHHLRKLENPYLGEMYNIKIIDKNGNSKWVEINGVGIDWEGRPATLNFLNDITEKRLLERQLIQKEKLSSLGVMVSSIAHEINNPNNFVSFNIPILKDYIKEMIPIVEKYAAVHRDFELCNLTFPEFRKDIFELLDNVKNGSDRISAFVSNLREFYQNKDMKPLIWIELKDVIERVLLICKGKIKNSVNSFEKIVPENLPSIRTEPYALEQILFNFLVNATQAVDKKDSWIKLSVSVVDSGRDQISIEVSDNGCGMDEETQHKIFDPFFTTKPIESGTGLGLFVSHMMAERLNGHIEFESVPDKGSTFRLILPVEKKN